MGLEEYFKEHCDQSICTLQDTANVRGLAILGVICSQFPAVMSVRRGGRGMLRKPSDGTYWTHHGDR